MTWIEKGQPTSFDEWPIHGLFFLDGDALAQMLNQHWTVHYRTLLTKLQLGHLKSDRNGETFVQEVLK